MNKKRQRSSSDSADKTSRSSIEVVVAKYGLIGTIVTALLGLCGLAVTGYFTYLGTRAQVFGVIEVTQTVEANRTSQTAISSTTISAPKTASPLIQTQPLPQIAATSPVTNSHDVACFYYQDKSQTPIEVLAETVKYSGSTSLALANGEKIPFKNIAFFELIEITAGAHALATITLVNGTVITEELKYGDSGFSGTTNRGRFSLDVDRVSQIVFGSKGSCQPSDAILTTPTATQAAVSDAHDVACFYYQDESQSPTEILAETLRNFGNSTLGLANGESIPFENIARVELLRISASNHTLVTITLTDGNALTEELKYGDSTFSGSTDLGKFSQEVANMKRIVFGAKGSCQQ